MLAAPLKTVEVQHVISEQHTANPFACIACLHGLQLKGIGKEGNGKSNLSLSGCCGLESSAERTVQYWLSS